MATAAPSCDLQSASVKELKKQLEPLCSPAQIAACVEKRDLIELLISVSPILPTCSWDWGSGYIPKQSSDKKVEKSSKPVEPPSLEKSKGADMMRKMGWKSGQGLGKNEEGRTGPIPLSTQKQRRGLGAQDLPEELKPPSAPWMSESEDRADQVSDPLETADEDSLSFPSKPQKTKSQQDTSVSKKARLEQQLRQSKAPHIRDIVRFG